jgi:hypothetical protein
MSVKHLARLLISSVAALLLLALLAFSLGSAAPHHSHNAAVGNAHLFVDVQPDAGGDIGGGS